MADQVMRARARSEHLTLTDLARTGQAVPVPMAPGAEPKTCWKCKGARVREVLVDEDRACLCPVMSMPPCGNCESSPDGGWPTHTVSCGTCKGTGLWFRCHKLDPWVADTEAGLRWRAYLGCEEACGVLGWERFYVLDNRFVKEGSFFASQGGLTEEWGKDWKPVVAESIEHARSIGNFSTWLTGFARLSSALPDLMVRDGEVCSGCTAIRPTRDMDGNQVMRGGYPCTGCGNPSRGYASGTGRGDLTISAEQYMLTWAALRAGRVVLEQRRGESCCYEIHRTCPICGPLRRALDTTAEWLVCPCSERRRAWDQATVLVSDARIWVPRPARDHMTTTQAATREASETQVREAIKTLVS